MNKLSTITLSLALLASAISNATYADEKQPVKQPASQAVKVNTTNAAVSTDAEKKEQAQTANSSEINDFFKSVLGENISVQTTESPSQEEITQGKPNNTNLDINKIDSELNALQNSVTSLSAKKEPTGKLTEEGALDLIFLRNVPEGTRLTVNKDYNVLPLNKYIIFHNGERVIESPLYQNPLTTFCYIELKPSGKARVLREGKQLVVTKNITTSSELQNKGEEWRGKIKVYQSKIFVDNENIKWISCYSASLDKQNKKPLAIKDLREQTNSAFKVEFPAYEEI
jgi:hypothetical protein